MSEWISPPLNRMSPHGLAVWTEAYGIGYAHGLAAAHDQAERDVFAFLSALRPLALEAANYGDLADRFDALGEHARAARQRQLLHNNGIDRIGGEAA